MVDLYLHAASLQDWILYWPIFYICFSRSEYCGVTDKYNYRFFCKVCCPPNLTAAASKMMRIFLVSLKIYPSKSRCASWTVWCANNILCFGSQFPNILTNFCYTIMITRLHRFADVMLTAWSATSKTSATVTNKSSYIFLWSCVCIALSFSSFSLATGAATRA